MRLHELQPQHKGKRRKRIARGGKRGTYAGRGLKGQKSRAGHKIKKAAMELIMRIPKRRGFRNKTTAPRAHTCNVGTLARRVGTLRSGTAPVVVNRATLEQVGVISRRHRGPIKILGQGEITFPVRTQGLVVSASAREKIEKAGGSIAP